MYCKKCGAKLEENAQFCSMCGCGIELKDEKTNNILTGKQNYSSKFNKIGIVVLSILLLFSVVCNVVQIVLPDEATEEPQLSESDQNKVSEYDDLVLPAIEALKIKWDELYRESEESNGYLEIFHTRVIDVKPNSSDTVFQELDRGMEIDYIVEFSLYSDYFSAAPYYHNAGTYDTVVVYDDGTTLVAGNFFRTYSNLTYSYDYSAFVEEITDLGNSYNQIIKLK